MNRPQFPDHFAASNPQKVDRLRVKIDEDLDFSVDGEGKPFCFKTMSEYSVRLPPLSEFPEEFVQRMSDNIVDRDMKDELESARAINWCRTTKPLLPLQTVGDGNCLLHAVSLALWGIQDIGMFLRRLLYITLVNDTTDTFKKRWRKERGYVNEHVPGLRLTTMDWAEEWEMVLKLGDDTPQHHPNDLMYSSLEEIHLFVLSNVLRRPIIVLADKVVRSYNGLSMQPNNFGGIYLPLHWEPRKCWKNPVVLGYSMFHFTPLVGSHDPFQKTLTAVESQHAVPLIHHDQTPLRLHFLLAEEENNAHVLLKSYLKVSEVVLTRQDRVNEIVVAQLSAKSLPEEVDVVRDYIQLCERQYREYCRSCEFGNPQRRTGPPEINILPRQSADPMELRVNASGHGGRTEYGGIPCVTEGCSMTGSPSTANMCSKCFAEFTKQDAEMEAIKRRAPKEPSAPFTTVEPLDENRLMRPTVVSEAVPIPTSDRSQIHLFLSHPQENSCICVSPLCEEMQISPEVKLCSKCLKRLMKNQGKNGRPNDQLEMPTEGKAWRREDQSELFGGGQFARLEVSSRGVNRPPTSISNCRTPGCNGSGKEQLQSLCAQCFMRTPSTDPGESARPSREKAAGHLKSEQVSESRLGSTAGQNDQSYFPQSLPQMSYDVNLTKQEILSRLPRSNTDMTGRPERRFECKNPACHETGFIDMKGLCLECFLQFYVIKAQREAQKTSGEPLRPAPEQNASKQLVLAQQPEARKEIYLHGATGDAHEEEYTKNICSTPGCEGIRLKNPHGMCHFCFVAATKSEVPRPNKASSAEGQTVDLRLSTYGAGVISTSGSNEAGGPDSEHLVESRAEPIPSSEVIVSEQQRKKCASPVCENLVFPPRNLCDQCVQTLTQAAVKVGQGTQCKTRGCEFHGAPEYFGYCSKCFEAVSVAEAFEKRRDLSKKPRTAPAAVGKGSSQHSAPLAKRAVAESQARSQTAPVVVRGKLCKTAGCSRYGDPAMADLCTRCYQIKFPICPSGAGLDMTSQPPFTQLYQQSSVVPVTTPGSSSKILTNLVTSRSSLDYQPGIAVTHQQQAFNFQRAVPSTEVEPTQFDQAMFRVASSRKAHKCKNFRLGCPNFGSLGRQGYCTSCYNDLRGEDVVDGQRIVY